MIKEIGQGEFGSVWEASAVNMASTVRVQTVAVKMLKANSVAAKQGFAREAVRSPALASILSNRFLLS